MGFLKMGLNFGKIPDLPPYLRAPLPKVTDVGCMALD